MKLIPFLKSATGFFVVIILAFACLMFALNAGYPYYPAPPESQLQQK